MATIPSHPRQPGRPSKMDAEKIELLRQAFAVDATIEEAAFYAGIHETTYYNWKKDNPALFEEIERLRLTPILKARQTIVNGLSVIENARWFLERKKKLEFSTRVETDVTSKGEAISNSDEIKKMSDQFDEFFKKKNS